jgi:hypothetical protein
VLCSLRFALCSMLLALCFIPHACCLLPIASPSVGRGRDRRGGH